MLVKVFVRGLTLTGHHGITAQERQSGQTLKVDITCEVAQTAGSTDQIEDTVDYTALATLFESVSATYPSQTLEHLANNYVGVCFTTFDAVKTIDISIAKVGLTLKQQIQEVGVQVVASRPPSPQ